MHNPLRRHPQVDPEEQKVGGEPQPAQRPQRGRRCDLKEATSGLDSEEEGLQGGDQEDAVAFL